MKKEKQTKKKSQNSEWFKLDNAALIYPSAATEAWNAVYRMSVYLKDEVDPIILQQAIESIMKRFPTFNVYLKKGFFWYYFQNVNGFPKLEQEKFSPCRPMEFKENKHLFRVLYYKNKISFEAFHSLTDGTGAVLFLTTLVSKYLSLCGVDFDPRKCPLNFEDLPFEEELEDSFSKYADLKSKASRKDKLAYQIHGRYDDNNKLNVVTGDISVTALKELSKRYGATITELLVALYFKVLLEYQDEKHSFLRPVKISVPVNLRKYFPSSTLRNFSSFINLEMGKDKLTYSIQELVDEVKTQMKLINKENLLKSINANVSSQRNFIVRVLPLFLKNVALSIGYSSFGEKLYTTVLTNVGSVKLPDELAPYIERFEVYIGKSKKNKMNIGVISYKDTLSLSFSSAIKELKIIRNYFRELSILGLEIKIHTNF